LPIARAVGDREQEAVVLTNIGRVYGTLGERRGALDRYETALQIFRSLGLRPAEATLLNNIGLIYSEMGQNDKAVEYYEQALNLNRAVKNSGGEALALYNIAFAEQEGDHLDEALARIQEAVGIVESLRIKIGAERLRASYFSTVQNYFDLYILILMRLHQQRPAGGYSNLALQASEQRRARALLEMLTEARADIRAGVDAQLLDRERSLVNALNSRAQMQMKLLARTSSEQQAAVIEQEIQKLTAELQQVEGEIRQKSPNYAALTQPRPLSVSEIQTQVVDADTVLLEYSLGVDRSYLWMVTPNAVTSYELPAREEIETAARELYELLKSADKWSGGSVDALRGGNRQLERETAAKPNPSIDPTKRSVPEVATRLTQMLLGPAALQIKGKRLLIVADGALQYIPFGALPVVAAESTETGYRPLLADHEIVTLPSASTIAVLRTEMTNRKPVDKSIALLADPVFESDDERVKTSVKATQSGSNAAKQRFRGVGFDRAASDAQIGGAGLRIPRLPATRDEAKRILALVPASASKQALDFNASRQTATSEELSHYRFVHFATHGFLDSVHPELSGIVLSLVDENGNPQDGFLRAHEVFNLKLPADLVVLSACQTGLGKEVRGEGLVGLTRGFMYAGAPRVVVSLWSVNDQATAELMARFYRGMLVEKLPPSAALRAAQISLMKEKQWQAPFYWAAFTLQGEWK
jgi:CHAT domain-containing protein